MWLDPLIEKIQKNPLFSLVILISIILTFLATVIGNITAIKNFIQSNPILSLSLLIAAILLVLVIVRSSSYFDRREWLRKVEWLKPGANISMYLGKFGDPMSVKSDEDGKKRKRYLFINTYFYLVLLTDMDDEVRTFALTIKNKAFRPIFKSPGYPLSNPSFIIKLGGSTFSEIPNHPEHIDSRLMAHYGHSYYETYYFGRPGYYQHYAFGINDAGYHPKDYSNWIEVFSNWYDLDSISDETLKKLQDFRSTAVFNTYAVSNDDKSMKDIFDKTLGVSFEQVRKLEDR